MKNKIVFAIIVFCLIVLEIVNPIFRPIFKYVFQETIIPYSDKSGLPNKNFINKTIGFLGEVKLLRLFFIQNKLYLQKAEEQSGYYERFNRHLSEKLRLEFKKFLYEDKLESSYPHKKSYLSSVYLSKNAKEYMLFEFSYKSNFEKGLDVHYKLFFDNRKKIEWKNKNYQSVIKLEKNWYLLIYTTVDGDSEQWHNVKSIHNEHIWDGIPPLNYIIKPYQHKEIEKIIKNKNYKEIEYGEEN